MSDGNDAKVLVEFSPEEIKWLADKLHELRNGWNMVGLFMAQRAQAAGEVSDKTRDHIELIEAEKKMEAVIRNRLVDKAADQGFGDL